MPEIPSWREDDGTEIWLVAGAGRGAVGDLVEREARATQAASAGAVLGANADADDDARLAQLASRGYERVFSMVELERDAALPAAPALPATDVDIRPVEPGDAAAMLELTRAVWAGRRYFTMPTLSRYQAWVRDADPTLMLLAWRIEQLVGYVAAEEDAHGVLLDDIQVHPQHQRLGIATDLMGRVIAETARRGLARLHLETEGDNPVGARDFYEGMGFRLVQERLRFRRPVRP